MLGWIILGIILAILLVVLLIPFGIDAGYEGGLLHVSAKLGGILVQLFPRKRKEPTERKRPKKPKKPKQKKEEPEEAPKEPKPKKKLSFSKEEILELLKIVFSSIGRFGRAWKVDRFVLRYVAGGPDPYKAAVSLAYMNAALSALAPICAKRFRVKDLDVRTDVDFLADSMQLDLGFAMTIRLAQILGVVFRAGFAALGILLRNKKRLRTEAKNAPESDQPLPAESGADQSDTEKEHRQDEERMEANGEQQSDR